MSHIHFVGGEKGGVGKSVVARLLAQWFIDRSAPFAGVDADTSHGALSRHYRDFTQSVDLSVAESADQIMDRALGAERQVVVDLPAQSARSLSAWLAGADVLAFARELQITLTFWQVCDGGFASIADIQSALELFGDRLQHVVVKNHGRSRDFSQFDDSAARQRLFELRGTVIDIPELDAGTMYSVDRHGLSFWAASHNGDGANALKPLERQRVKLWLQRCYEQFEGLTMRTSARDVQTGETRA